MSFSVILRPPTSSLFPYTTLFRSRCVLAPHPAQGADSRADAGRVRENFCDGVQAARHGDASGSRRISVHPVLHAGPVRSEEHTSELQSRGHLVCRLLLEKKKPPSP